MAKLNWIAPNVLQALKRSLTLSAQTLHKIMNPNCVECAFERGLAIIHGKTESSTS